MDVHDGEHSVTVTAEGYYSQSVIATVQADATITLGFTLEAIPPTQDGTVLVSSIDYSTITGKHLIVKISLIDGNRAGVVGATVSIEVWPRFCFV